VSRASPALCFPPHRQTFSSSRICPCISAQTASCWSSSTKPPARLQRQRISTVSWTLPASLPVGTSPSARCTSDRLPRYPLPRQKFALGRFYPPPQRQNGQAQILSLPVPFLLKQLAEN